MRQIFSAFHYMQKSTKDKILHRDIKLENIFLMLDDEDPRGVVRKMKLFTINEYNKIMCKKIISIKLFLSIKAVLGDFGFARRLKDGNMANTYLGSPLTMAPEIAEGKPYDYSCDMYSLGVVFYQMLFGKFPYQHPESKNNPAVIAQVAKKGELDFNKNGIEISEKTQKLLRGMLAYNPKKRISFTEVYAFLGID